MTAIVGRLPLWSTHAHSHPKIWRSGQSLVASTHLHLHRNTHSSVLPSTLTGGRQENPPGQEARAREGPSRAGPSQVPACCLPRKESRATLSAPCHIPELDGSVLSAGRDVETRATPPARAQEALRSPLHTCQDPSEASAPSNCLNSPIEMPQQANQ